MDWKNIISDLAKHGVKQYEIAAFCGCSQSVISDLGSGNHKTCSYEIGSKLVELHKRKIKTKKAA